MTPRNGSGARQHRPRIEVTVPAATPHEAAAIAAALEHFIAETSAAAPAPEPRSRWQLAALREGISNRQTDIGGWGPTF